MTMQVHANSTVQALTNLLDMAKSGQIKSFLFAGFQNEQQDAIYSSIGLDVTEQQHLTSLLQVQTTSRSIDERTVLELVTIQELLDRGHTPDEIQLKLRKEDE